MQSSIFYFITAIGSTQRGVYDVYGYKFRKRVGGGSRIGLTIAGALVEAQSGRIWAESPSEGQRNTFAFTLPIVKSEPRRALQSRGCFDSLYVMVSSLTERPRPIMQKITVLPKPAGSYQIGFTHLNFVDESRVDSSPQANGKNRDVPIIIWYPIDEPGERPPSKLLKIRDLASLKQYPLYKLIPNRICNIGTNSYQDLPLSTKKSKFPVLIFNHGFSSYMEQNTILMEHLTSFGYIVVSVGHPYDGVASYPDGRSIPVDLESIKELTKQSRATAKTFSKNIKLLARNDLSIEDMRTFTENYLNASKSMNDKVEMWVEDVRFILDILEKMDGGFIQSSFAHRLSLEKGIGVFGQSYGGAASVLACCLDNRLQCGINMDGAMYGGMNAKYRYRRPTMYMDSDMLPGRSKYFFYINEDDTYHIMIKGSKHLDYSDFTYFAKIWLLKLMQLFGKIDGRLMIKITNDYVLAFFDKYIKQIDAPLLERNPYHEVVFEKRLHK